MSKCEICGKELNGIVEQAEHTRVTRYISLDTPKYKEVYCDGRVEYGNAVDDFMEEFKKPRKPISLELSPNAQRIMNELIEAQKKPGR